MSISKQATASASTKLKSHSHGVPPSQFDRWQGSIVNANPGARIDLIRKGFTADKVVMMSEYFDIPRASFTKLLGMSPATTDRKIKNSSVLGQSESERMARILLIEAEAEKVFGTSASAKKWLLTDNQSLGVAPLSLLDTETGAIEVRRILSAIAYGGVA